VSVGKQVMSLEGFTKNLGRVNVPDVGRNEVPDLWTACGERACGPKMRSPLAFKKYLKTFLIF